MKRRPTVRVLGWTFAAVLLLLLVVAGAGLLVLANLGSETVRSFVSARVRDATGIVVDWRDASLSPSGGLVLSDVRVAQPDGWDRYAPDLLAINRVELAWTIDGLRSTPPVIEAVRLEGVSATLVQDQAGTTSLDPILDRLRGPAPSVPAEPPAPLSRLLDLHGAGFEVRRVELAGLSARRLLVRDGQVAATQAVSGIGLAGSARAAPGALVADASLTGAPARVELTEGATARTADLRLDISLNVPDGRHARLKARVSSDRQDIFEELPGAGDILTVEADVAFLPEEGLVRAELSRLSVLDEVATASALLEVPDRPGAGPAVLVRKAAVSIRADRVPRDPFAAVLAPIELSDTTIEVAAEEVGLGGPDAIAFSGPVRAAVQAGRVAVELAGRRVEVEGLDASVTTPGVRLPAPPATASARVAFGRLRVGNAGAPPVDLGAGRIDIGVRDLALDATTPVRSTGSLDARVDALGVRLSAAVDKGAPDEAGFHVAVEAPRLAAAAALLPPAIRRAIPLDLGRVSVSMSADGQAAALDRSPPALSASSRWRVERIAASFGKQRLDLPRVDLDAKGRLDGHSIQAELSGRASSPGLDGRQIATRVDVLAKASVSHGRRDARLTVAADHARGRLLDLSADLAHSGDRLHWVAEVRSGDMKPVADILPRRAVRRLGIAWDGLAARLSTHGDLAGVVSFPGGGFLPSIARDPVSAARGRQHAELAVSGLRYKKPGMEVSAPDLHVKLDSELKTGAAGATIAASHERLDIDLPGRHVRVSGAAHDISIELGRLAGAPGRVGVTLASTVREVEQAFVQYPVRGLSLKLHAGVNEDGSVRLDDLRLVNEGGGTTLDLDVAYDEAGEPRSRRPEVALAEGPAAPPRVPGRKALALTGTLVQRLEPVSVPGVFTGRGTVRIPLTVQSGDLLLFNILASLETQDVDVELPGLGVTVKGLNGRTPIVEDLSLGPTGVSIAGRTGADLWSFVRFQDAHPFLTGDTFVTAERVKAGSLDIGPLAGNLRVAHHIVALDQIEASWRGGRVTGQVVVDAREKAVSFRGDVTGARPSGSDESLLANAALRLSLRTMEAAGRVQVVHIGRGHLLDLLDMIDPLRQQVAINRVRRALGMGAGGVEFVGLRMEDGFLSARVALSGLASVVRIDEIRGVAVAPIMRRLMDQTFMKRLVESEGGPG